MNDDMPRPETWVSIAAESGEFFVHVREGESRDRYGPYQTNREATLKARSESERLGLDRRQALAL